VLNVLPEFINVDIKLPEFFLSEGILAIELKELPVLLIYDSCVKVFKKVIISLFALILLCC
jgi:hypothetical protein